MDGSENRNEYDSRTYIMTEKMNPKIFNNVKIHKT